MQRPSGRRRRGWEHALPLAAVAALLPVFAAAPAHAAATARYTITDLGTLGTQSYSQSYALAVNNAGVVVGTSDGRPFRWANGVLTELVGLPGGGGGEARAINDAGQIAGLSTRTGGGYGYPVKWSAAGAITDLGGPVTNELGAGNGIDPAGRVVGGQRSATSEASPNAMIYDVSGTRTALANPQELLGMANAINAVGQVVGNPAFLWKAGTLTTLPGLPSVPGTGYTANAINIRGQIVGSAGSPAAPGLSATHGVLWQGGTITDIGTIDGIVYSQATGINAAGQVVGTADPMCQPCAAPKAWVWQPGGTITALDTLIPAGSGWQLRTAAGINDHGQIVGTGLINGSYHGYLLTPLFHAAVNFQPAGAATPAGYAADAGLTYAARNGLSYGWTADASTYTRDRNAAASPDQRYDTFLHTQHPTSANQWELAVPNGTYTVHLVAGDPSYTDSVYRFTVEATAAIAGTPTAANPWSEATVRVTVTDGRLTVANGAGAVNNKLNFLEVFSS